MKEQNSYKQNSNANGQVHTQNVHKEKVDTKDQIIGTMLTMRKLQKKLIIPSQIKPINLNTQQIRYTNKNSESKYLLVSTKNIVYYGQLNNYGYPQSNSGMFIYSDGSYYEGQVKNGKPQGRGRITNLQNSYSYIGQWKKGVPSGFGKQQIGTNIYEGEFHMGKKNGKGKLSYEDGSYYEGYFDNNIIHGEGKFYSKNNFWEGTWKNGYLEGKGRQIIAKQDIINSIDIQNLKAKKDTSQYKGEFVKGQKSGFGNFKWNKNYQYEGNFSKGQLDGQGIFKFKGKVYAGVWSNGTEVKIHELIKGVPSVILSGNIKGDGSIIVSNSVANKKSGIEQLSNFSTKLKSIQQLQNQESNPRNNI